MKPTSNGRVRNIQLGEEIGILIANRIAEPGVVAASRKSYLRTISYRHLDAPTFRIGFETSLLYKSVVLQLQRANSRMSWNAARCLSSEARSEIALPRRHDREA